MFSPAYEFASASAAVRASLGDPVRLHDFGDAKQDGSKPYAVQQVITGTPENYLGETPDLDSLVVQFDVYGLEMSAVKAAASALRDALQNHGYVTSFNGQSREVDTRLWRVSFTVEFKTPR
jgi:hypothetical protein